jgi:hypothetical protein
VRTADFFVCGRTVRKPYIKPKLLKYSGITGLRPCKDGTRIVKADGYRALLLRVESVAGITAGGECKNYDYEEKNQV